MIEEMKLRNFSLATQESYLYAVTRITKHYRRSPDQLDKEQIRSYLLYLSTERKVPQHPGGTDRWVTLFYNQKRFSPATRQQNSRSPKDSIRWSVLTFIALTAFC
jgi:hypothetical protein